tara:strand:- start:1758 stop:1916 length:159 start_codon:yes stop_codon:yes gene_type:complete
MREESFERVEAQQNLEQRGQESNKENDLKDGKEGNLIGTNIRDLVMANMFDT